MGAARRGTSPPPAARPPCCSPCCCSVHAGRAGAHQHQGEALCAVSPRGVRAVVLTATQLSRPHALSSSTHSAPHEPRAPAPCARLAPGARWSCPAADRRGAGRGAVPVPAEQGRERRGGRRPRQPGAHRLALPPSMAPASARGALDGRPARPPSPLCLVAPRPQVRVLVFGTFLTFACKPMFVLTSR